VHDALVSMLRSVCATVPCAASVLPLVSLPVLVCVTVISSRTFGCYMQVVAAAAAAAAAAYSTFPLAGRNNHTMLFDESWTF